MAAPRTSLLTASLLLLLSPPLNTATATAVPQPDNGGSANLCTDGSTFMCCAATFNGDDVPVRLATDLACYDLTPASTNCFLPGAADLVPDLLSQQSGCAIPQCCHIPLNPLLGLYCGPPPGPCQGPEKSPRCLDVIDGRFGHCPGVNPGTGRQVAASQGDAPAKNPSGLDLGGLVPGVGKRDVEGDVAEGR